jgi:hypothetical protein
MKDSSGTCLWRFEDRFWKMGRGEAAREWGLEGERELGSVSLRGDPRCVGAVGECTRGSVVRESTGARSSVEKFLETTQDGDNTWWRFNHCVIML